MKANDTPAHAAQTQPAAVATESTSAAPLGAAVATRAPERSALQAKVARSPRMVAQRRAMQAAVGPAANPTAPIQRARWLYTNDAWVNPDTLAPIGADLHPPAPAQEGDVWDDVTLEHTSASNRLAAIFAGTSNRAPALNLPTSEEFLDQLSNLGKPSIDQRVRNALQEIPTEKLSKETIVSALEKHFKDFKPGLNAATRDPLFSETLLEGIRHRQSEKWIRETEPKKVAPKKWANDELQHWNVRHYTSKLNIVLGDDLGEGIFTVAGIEAPPFNEILSTVTLATMKPGGGIQNAKRSGDRMLMTYTGGAASSGHTTSLDWANVGNVGDTFYGLFYKDKPATGITPPFITDAVYYAKWSAEAFGIGWASADWLGTAAHSREKNGPTPGGIARTGSLSDIIASIFPEATTRDFSQTGEVETKESEERRKQAFSAMANFEIKKHGPMPVNAWIPVADNINKTRAWWVDTTKGKFVKLKPLLPRPVQETIKVKEFKTVLQTMKIELEADNSLAEGKPVPEGLRANSQTHYADLRRIWKTLSAPSQEALKEPGTIAVIDQFYVKVNRSRPSQAAMWSEFEA